MRNAFVVLVILLLHGPNICSAPGSGDNYTPTSVLASGKWYKIPVTEEGIYRLNYSTLKQLGLEYPSNPRIFGNNHGQLSYYNDDPSPDDLKEIAIYTFTGGDGILNEGDYILFYAQGTGRWVFDDRAGEFTHLRHNYSDTAYYFITSGNQPGKKIMTASMEHGPPNQASSTSDLSFIHEIESENLLHSGREWYQPVSSFKEITIDPELNNLVPGEKIKYRLKVIARGSTPTSFRLTENDRLLEHIDIQGIDMGSLAGLFARPASVSGDFVPSSGNPLLKLYFLNNGNTPARGWLDYLILNARIKNNFIGKTIFFTDSKSSGLGTVTEFTINTTVNDVHVWDVTDPFQPEIIPCSKNDNTVTFISRTDTIRRFSVFMLKDLPEPSGLKPVSSQDLHASPPVDMIIITHPLFLLYASRLAAIHSAESGLVSMTVTPMQIYNEFSGGIPDIVAIRNFVRMKYLKQKDGQRPLKYLLLFGDGSFNNKIMPPGNPNFVPTYQSLNSTAPVTSFSSDDFYGLLDDGEGEETGTLDIGIGRIPVSDTLSASKAVSKISRYIYDSYRGGWKNIVCLTADDEDGNTHVSDAEGLAAVMEKKAPWLNLKKIYLDAFPQVTTSTGQFYPDVVQAIDEQINAGCLIFNYTGHGNEISLAHERIVTSETSTRWRNADRLPLFITATCEFSRFDDAEPNIATGTLVPKNSLGEKILLGEGGGAIALMSTTRLSYSSSNYSLNRQILEVAFERDTEGQAARLGDMIRFAKNRAGNSVNNRNFTLLGDPALRLAWPWQGRIVTDSINNIPASEFTDTLKALSVVTITGHVENLSGNTLNDFNGLVAPVVFDKSSEKQTLANDGGPVFRFKTRENILFSGQTRAENGKFRFNFLVPRDMDYSFGKGSISYYAFDENREMTGVLSEIMTGGFNNSDFHDNSGPVIKLFLNDTLFRNGGITTPDPWLLAILEDETGLNISGAGIGHDLVFWLDHDRSNPVVLNKYFSYETGRFGKGTARFRLTGLSPGEHSITIKAWDNFNNSSEKTISFIVNDDPGLVLKNPLNYPNPFKDVTYITAQHNQPDAFLKVKVEIFNTAGKLIRVLTENMFSNGYQLPPLEWDGRSGGNEKIASGLYPYRLTVSTQNGESSTISGRMIIY